MSRYLFLCIFSPLIQMCPQLFYSDGWLSSMNHCMAVRAQPSRNSSTAKAVVFRSLCHAKSIPMIFIL